MLGRFAALLSVVVMVACGHGDYVWVDNLPASELAPESYRIYEGDELSVSVWNQPKLSTDAIVRSDGRVTLPLIGDVAASGLTPAGLAEQLDSLFGPYVVDPRTTVIVKNPKIPTVSVLGEVKNVGEYQIQSNDTLLELIARAGGMTEYANPDAIFVLRRAPGKIRIRFTYLELTRGQGRALSFRPRRGDVIVIE